jgi:hypothetical protein
MKKSGDPCFCAGPTENQKKKALYIYYFCLICICIAKSPNRHFLYSAIVKVFFSPFLVLKRKKYKSMGCVSPKSGDLAMPEKSLDLSMV